MEFIVVIITIIKFGVNHIDGNGTGSEVDECDSNRL